MTSGGASVRWTWVPNFPRFTALGLLYSSLLLLMDRKLRVPKLQQHREPAYVSFFERPAELSTSELSPSPDPAPAPAPAAKVTVPAAGPAKAKAE